MEKIVVLDSMSITNTKELVRPNIEHEWVSYESTDAKDIVERAKDATIIATNKCKITKEVIDKLPKLKFIAELATGYNNIDIDYCKQKGIAVANVQGYSTQSVAEHTLTLMLMLSRSMVATRHDMEQGKWINANCFCLTSGPIIDLKDKTLVVIGAGSIGKKIIEIAKAFSMKTLKAEHKNAVNVREGYTKFEDAIAQADFISLNCPLTKETTDLITDKEIALMKKSVFIINNARGGVINEQCLADAILNKTIAGAATDVVSVEPLAENHPYTKLLKCDNFIITPHQAWMSYASIVDLCEQFAQNIEAFCRGEMLRRIV